MRIDRFPISSDIASWLRNKDTSHEEFFFFFEDSWQDHEGYFFRPDEMPPTFIGAAYFTIAYAAFIGAYSCYTPYYRNSKGESDSTNIRFVNDFLKGFDFVDLSSLFDSSLKKISDINPSVLKLYDEQELNDTAECERIHSIVWNKEIEKYICDDNAGEQKLLTTARNYILREWPFEVFEDENRQRAAFGRFQGSCHLFYKTTRRELLQS